MQALSTYEVFALGYANNPTQTAARNFIDGDAHHQLMPLDYFIWLIRGSDRAYVIDTGFDAQAAKERSRVLLATPAELLSTLAIDSEQVSDVIVTHLPTITPGTANYSAGLDFICKIGRWPT